MNRAEMRGRVRTVVREDAGTFITDDDINNWLAEANIDLAARLELLTSVQTHTLVPISGNEIPLPADWLKRRSLRLGTEDDVSFVDDDVFWSWVDSAGSPSSILAITQKNIIYLYPTPDAGTAYSLQYYRLPVAMSDTQTSEMPESFHVKLVNYARAHAKFKDGELDEGNNYLALYEQGLPQPSQGTERTFPGPLSMRFSPGPFDLDPDAKHI
jgi:hypothetical protein